jgi:hypothetical protein
MKKKLEQDKLKKTIEATKKPSTSTTTPGDAEKKRKLSSNDSDVKRKKLESGKSDKKESSKNGSEKKPAAAHMEKSKSSISTAKTPQVKKEEKKSSSSTTEKLEKKDKDKKSSANRDLVEEEIFGLERMDKHNIVSAILRRWKYCLDDWPGEVPAQPPAGFIESHIPGLYVGASNLVLGQLKDMRPFIHGKTPSMESLLTYKAVALQELLLKGINKQLTILENVPGEEKLKASLRRELEKAQKLKVKKIERKYRAAVAMLGEGSKPKHEVIAATEETKELEETDTVVKDPIKAD